MKLRNKKTGEIINSEDLFTDDFIIDLFSKNFSYFDAKVNEIQKEWEVYKDPKDKYYFITWSGYVDDETDDGFEVDKTCKEIGNYFKTKEEAKKTVEKLKAWKRLKDKGFRFDGWTFDDGLRISICTNTDSDGIYDDDKKEMKEDLDICFGGEDE